MSERKLQKTLRKVYIDKKIEQIAA